MAGDPTLPIRSLIFQAINNAAASADPAVRQEAQDALIALRPTHAGWQALQALAAGTAAEKVRAIRIATHLLTGELGGT